MKKIKIDYWDSKKSETRRILGSKMSLSQYRFYKKMKKVYGAKW